MNIVCEKCNTVYRLDETKIPPEGKKVKCSKCQHVFLAMAADKSESAPTEPEQDLAAELSEDEDELEEKPKPSPTPKAAADTRRKRILLRQDGTRYSMNDLATLQRWIVEKRVSKDAEISEDGEVWEKVTERMDLIQFFGIVEQSRRKRAAAAEPRPKGAPSPSSKADRRGASDDDSAPGLALSLPSSDSVLSSALPQALVQKPVVEAGPQPTQMDPKDLEGHQDPLELEKALAAAASPRRSTSKADSSGPSPAEEARGSTDARPSPTPRSVGAIKPTPTVKDRTPPPTPASDSKMIIALGVAVLIGVVLIVVLVKGPSGTTGTTPPSVIVAPVASPAPAVLASGTGATGTGAAGSGSSGTGLAGTGLAGTGLAGTGVAAPTPAPVKVVAPPVVAPSPAPSPAPVVPSPKPESEKVVSKPPTEPTAPKQPTSPSTTSTSSDANKLIKDAQAYTRKHQYQEAVDALELAAEKNPSSGKVHRELGLALISLSYVKAGSRDQLLNEAVGHLKTATQLESSIAESYHYLGVAYMEMGKKNEARQAFNTAIAKGLKGDAATEVNSFLRTLGDGE